MKEVEDWWTLEGKAQESIWVTKALEDGEDLGRNQIEEKTS